MSAIAGIYHLNEDPIAIEQGESLMRALQKYPADDVQTWQYNPVFFGCHAQWITPESIGERLPCYDPARGLAITADAIIDNRDELYDPLQVDQAYRRQISDSEIILLAYQKWGKECPKYLIGDFAFMIWDDKKRCLFGARDFSGSRTLYYCKNQHQFAFCTVIHPLFCLPFLQRELNEQWMAEYLAIPWNFESIDPSATVYKNIGQVPPSHTISVMNGRVLLSKYSTLEARERLQLHSNQEYEEAFRDVFQRAVRSKLRTHRNVGAHLSGGLDSGSVVSFGARILKSEDKPLHTFSYVPLKGFSDWTHKRRVADERPFIQSTVQHVGNIKDYYFDFEGKSPLSEVDDWLDLLEMPYKFFENTFWLKGIFEQAHQHGVGVLLNGQRGNWTISWGPAMDYQAMLLKRFHWVRFFRELHLFCQNMGAKKSWVLPTVGKKAFPLLYHLRSAKGQEQFPMMINPDFAARMNVFAKLQEHDRDVTGYFNSNAYEIRKKQFEKLYYWSINGTYETKLSLRYALWERDPTNDLRVIRFCLSVPEDQYVQNGVDRSLIRRSTKNYLPDKVRLNQRTRGVQGADGIQRMTVSWKKFIAELHDLSLDPLASCFLNMKSIREAIGKIQGEPKPEYIYELDFRLLMRSLIVYRFIKKWA
jgi:asparagine synthase (glutamine-hydrolysing)